MKLSCFCLVWLVIRGLKNKFEEAARRNDVKAIVLTGNFDLDCMFVMIFVAPTHLIKGMSYDYIELCHFHVSMFVSCLVYVSVLVLQRSMIFCFYENGFVQFMDTIWFDCWSKKICNCLSLSPLNSGKGGRFSGGFDISVMQKVHQTGKLGWLIWAYIQS